MSRTPHNPAELGDTAGPMPAGHAITVAGEQETADLEREAAFEAARALGQIESAQFSARVQEKVIVDIFLKLKKNKAYRAIKYRDEAGNLRKCADLEEFCRHFLGASYRKVKEMADNYHLVGAELFEQAERLGFKRNDYRDLKALPADDQEAIKAAMQTDDRDQILGLMQELATRHASEKTALTAKAKEAEDTAAARDTIIQNKEARLNDLEEQNHKLKRRVETATPDEVVLEIRAEADLFAFRAEHAIGSDLRKAFEALTQQGGAHSEYMLGLITQIELAAAVLRADYGLLKAGPDGDPTPYWERGIQPAVN